MLHQWLDYFSHCTFSTQLSPCYIVFGIPNIYCPEYYVGMKSGLEVKKEYRHLDKWVYDSWVNIVFAKPEDLQCHWIPESLSLLSIWLEEICLFILANLVDNDYLSGQPNL